MKKLPKLVIWDFDGVISDTEHLWIKNWQIMLKNKFGVEWDFVYANKILGGLSPKTKIQNLEKLGFAIDDNFLNELKKLDWEAMAKINPVPNVEEILKLDTVAKCIATGGNLDKTERKLDFLGFDIYFPKEHIFTAQQVKNGKPEPDLFLYAAKQMGYSNHDSIVIEDSIAGLTAGLKANMLTIAFLGCPMNNNSENIEKVREIGIKHIFFDMKELKKFILSIS